MKVSEALHQALLILMPQWLTTIQAIKGTFNLGTTITDLVKFI